MPTRTVLRYVPHRGSHHDIPDLHTPPQIEEQRRYLGGDSEHTVLVKGLDFALLEQNKARATAATEDDDALEQVFQEASSSLPKKRTREEIVNELKSKRLKGSGTPEGDVLKVVDAPLEEAKKAGKFKPIGFKPIGSADGAKKKKKVKVKAKAKEDAAGVKKKVTTKPVAKPEEGKAPAPSEPATVASTSKNVPSAQPAPEPEPEPLDDEFDIFAGAGEYTGVDLGDDEESEGEISETGSRRARTSATPDAEAAPSRHWFETEEEKAQRPPASPPRSKSPPPEPISEEREEGEEEEEAPARLAPLASSSIPSIRDFLAMDAEAEKVEKRRAKKEKKKKGLP